MNVFTASKLRSSCCRESFNTCMTSITRACNPNVEHRMTSSRPALSLTRSAYAESQRCRVGTDMFRSGSIVEGEIPEETVAPMA